MNLAARLRELGKGWDVVETPIYEAMIAVIETAERGFHPEIRSALASLEAAVERQEQK